MIPRLTAVRFDRFMGTGRTTPALFACEDDSGNNSGELIVKLRGGLDRGLTGLACELIASRLATHFGLMVPEPALVMIDAKLAALVVSLEGGNAQSVKGDRMLKSVGLNFGTRQLSGVNTWPVDKSVPDGLWQAATDVFAFDALIQNPDRRFNNTNLLTRGNDLFVFDHELSFSFLEGILLTTEPWRLDGQRYLDQHVFFRVLKSKIIDVTGFAETLADLSGPSLKDIFSDVPPEWNNKSLQKIEQHLMTVSAHAGEFAEEVRRRLA